jgi:hypothetical protein
MPPSVVDRWRIFAHWPGATGQQEGDAFGRRRSNAKQWLIMKQRLVFGVLGLVASFAALHWYTLALPGRSHIGSLPTLSAGDAAMSQTLRRHVEDIASRPHNTDYPQALEASARTIEATLVALGYTPQSQKFMAAGIEVRNIEVVIGPTHSAAGISLRPDAVSTLVVGAHYDSAGDAPGANDNGSGVAALLEIARLLRQHKMVGTRLRLVFFVNEEPPHFKTEAMGSLVYVRALMATGERVRAMLSLESLGSYSDVKGSQKYPPLFSLTLPDTANFVAVVGTLGVRALAADVTRRFRESAAFPSLGAVAPGFIPGITWSDHWSFGRFGIPAVMITDTAIFRDPHYHLPSDTPDKLDYDRLARVTVGLSKVIAGMAN